MSVSIASPASSMISPATKTTPATATRPQTINILLTSFAGLGLPRTLSLPVSPNTPTCDVVATILGRLPPIDHPLIITTTSNKQLLSSSNTYIASLLTHPEETFLPLRLSARLCGGKGGFGSQLRAAGGRMSSRKNRGPNAADPNGSNRNLDGRRLRTVNEAKRLADYLAIKPEMEKKEREERKKRWEAVVATAEKREEEIRAGRLGAGQGRLDAEFVEGKEEAEGKTREAVLRALREEMERRGSESSVEGMVGGSEEGEGSGSSGESGEGEGVGGVFFGWDEDEDDEEEDDGDEVGEGRNAMDYGGKGKARAT
ncbi:hypothetical protein LTR62_006224 [Meristemomyces frigidus]|uniref:Sde2 N-terminal ubiquitin domain-containing protein n=1 Tax=Meristemomyces frigidus TaxID=1508187 RepID=A0AAN7YIS1_9PEZI|nr:hypothetical protein LTR62_006224 [Meristemomyces frigidus]